MIKSPCVNICLLINKVTAMVCKGCLRTQDEIKEWSSYSAQEKQKVLTRIGDTHAEGR